MKQVYRQESVADRRDIAEKLREMASMVEKGCIRYANMELDLENKQSWSVKIKTDEEQAVVSMKIGWKRGVLAPEIEAGKEDKVKNVDDSKLI